MSFRLCPRSDASINAAVLSLGSTLVASSSEQIAALIQSSVNLSTVPEREVINPRSLLGPQASAPRLDEIAVRLADEQLEYDASLLSTQLRCACLRMLAVHTDRLVCMNTGSTHLCEANALSVLESEAMQALLAAASMDVEDVVRMTFGSDAAVAMYLPTISEFMARVTDRMDVHALESLSQQVRV